MPEATPTVVVLCERADERPPHLETLAGRLDLRYTDEAGLPAACDGAHGVFLWQFFSSALERAWSHCDALEWVHIAAAGVDRLMFDGLRESDVVVTNAQGTFDRPIAEFVLASVLAHLKLLHESRALQVVHTWQHRESRSLRGSRALVIGTGGIGRETARLLRAVGMEVAGAGRVARDDDADFGTVVASSDLVAHAGAYDVVVNAAPLTPATRGLVDRTVFDAMPSHAYFVNVGRGPSVVEADLAAALTAGSIAGAALDVFETEPLPKTSVLWDIPGLSISAHMSGDVVGWQDTLARQFVDNAERWLAGEPLANVVDKRLGYVRGVS